MSYDAEEGCISRGTRANRATTSEAGRGYAPLCTYRIVAEELSLLHGEGERSLKTSLTKNNYSTKGRGRTHENRGLAAFATRSLGRGVSHVCYSSQGGHRCREAATRKERAVLLACGHIRQRIHYRNVTYMVRSIAYHVQYTSHTITPQTCKYVAIPLGGIVIYRDSASLVPRP